LNIHFHLLVIDGVYLPRDNAPPLFRWVMAPDRVELKTLVQRISHRIGRCLERQGLLTRDAEAAWLNLETPDTTDPMAQLLGSSVTYRVAVGLQQGRKAFMLQTLAPIQDQDKASDRVAKLAGFSLHAGVRRRPILQSTSTTSAGIPNGA